MDYDFPETVGNGKSSQLLLTQIFQRGRVKNHQPVTGASQRTGPGESAPELSTFYLLQDDYMHIVLIIVHCLYTDMYKMYVYIYMYYTEDMLVIMPDSSIHLLRRKPGMSGLLGNLFFPRGKTIRTSVIFEAP